MVEHLQNVFAQYWRARYWRGEEWRPASRYSVAAWLIFYIGFLIYAFSKHGAFLFIDLAPLSDSGEAPSSSGWCRCS